ncbi:YesL family protein [Oceanirhabdus sp. W0125-5]|uniref:YesL family protein n=1 Tax=Oceanirhabdus sp. W0125-5 TaxID=2999116 RepID=UPI0022F3293C|nr:DUF624 domain-containing protein [Oceanirhabdus sp. W0125-5]WBW99085.1 DUF624 domain-containing protein [Oceanirhabdus sp. W0125-5]
MDSEKSFSKLPIFTMINYFYWFFIGNMYFALVNIPLLFLLFFSSAPRSIQPSLVEIYLFCLPVGPAFTALLGVMGKFIREKDLSITKDFFRMYKRNFKQSLLIWSIDLAALIILYVDIKFINNVFGILFIILFMIAFLIGVYIFPLISRFHLKTKDAVVLSFICIFKHFKVTLLLIISLIASGLAFYSIPGVSILFIGSIVCYSIMYFQKDILKDFEEKAKANT